MASVMDEFGHLKIHLEELRRATNNFQSNVIGAGGFGNVYEGEVSHFKGRSMVAIKRLNREFGQGEPEFWKEIMILSRYNHKNLISLLGFCNEDGEKILVYEHAFNGSLDRHLSSTLLTWTQRLRICLDAARGLNYLHDHKGSQQRVLHRDIKSANILLDENWNAKLSDMGLSKIGPANQRHTVLFTNVVGTPGYCDPQYMETYGLTKESDIYSFGVVLCEILCGSLCFKYTNGGLEILVPKWKQSLENKKVHHIIFKDLTLQMAPASLETFSNVAFQCLHSSRTQRPIMSHLVKKLELALRLQVNHDMKLTNIVGISQKCGYVDELSLLLYKGKELFLNMGKTKMEGAKGKDAGGNGGSAAIAGIEAVPVPQQVDTTAGKRAGKELIVHLDDTMRLTVDDLLSGSAKVMGKSSYGTHYNLTLKNGDHIAVNRLGKYFTKNHTEFVRELNSLGIIRHPNLLTVRAYYLHPKGEKVIIYDYMSKGSLANFLHARGPMTRVDWPTRMQIAKGVVRGLLSLHTHDIIHRNLTSRNVWLDEKNNPKISDFGLSHSDTIAPARFLGYQAPEVFKLNKGDTKVDMYSLGVIMLELLTGKSPCVVDLPQWVASISKEEWKHQVFDTELTKDISTVSEIELNNSLQLALKCVHPSPQDRPDAQWVLQLLEKIRPELTSRMMRIKKSRKKLNRLQRNYK